jgi:hypothetical protein
MQKQNLFSFYFSNMLKLFEDSTYLLKIEKLESLSDYGLDFSNFFSSSS